MENVFGTDWDHREDRDGFRSHRIRLGRRLGGEMIGATVYVLSPGQKSFPYHLHRANEELLLVLEGSVVARTPGGEEEMGPCDAVVFPVGPDGAHQVINRSHGDARYIMFSTMVSPEIAEYPDSGNVGLFATDNGGGSLHRLLDGDAERDYFHGED